MFIKPENIYLHVAPIDFRKSINGLHALVEQEMDCNPFESNAMFVFSNRARNKLKILYWDNTGFALWYKRLERNTFKWPKLNDSKLVLNTEQLSNLLAGFTIIGHSHIDISRF